jgi:peptidoglycan/LPS O-acetylase OafA/YrhL
VSHLEVILPIPSLLVIPGGTVSLDMFFVLSGFLITMLLLREQARYGKVGRLAFYRRRIMRLLPALAVVIVVTSIVAYTSHWWTKRDVPSILSVSFYYSNYYEAVSPNAYCANLAPGFSHLWSLSFEEQFYLVWPWVTIAVLSIRTRLRTVVIVLLSLIALVAIHRAISYHGLDSWCALFHRTDTRADSILWGALLAHIWVRGREPKRGVRIAAWIAAGFLLVCLPFADLTGPFLYRGGLVAIDFACAVIILAILEGRWIGRHLFELKPFVGLGLVSYAFYLWHMPVFYEVRHVGRHWNDVERVTVALLATLALTIASWYLLERPMMRWKDRIEARRPKSDAAPPPTTTPVVAAGSEADGPALATEPQAGSE